MALSPPAAALFTGSSILQDLGSPSKVFEPKTLTELACVLHNERQRAFNEGRSRHAYGNGGGLRVTPPKFRDHLLPPKPELPVAQLVGLVRKCVERLGVLRPVIRAPLDRILHDRICTCACSFGNDRTNCSSSLLAG